MMLLPFLTLTAIIALATNALLIDSTVHIARHHLIARNLSDSTKRDSQRCKSRPSSSSVTSTSTSVAAQPTTTQHTATPAASPSPAGGKAGIAWSPGNNGLTLKSLVGKRTSFVYNWDYHSPGETFGLEYIPMLWGPNFATGFQQTVVAGYAKHVFGFNEPDNSGQSSIDAGYAAALWKQYIQPLKNEGYQLITPAVTSAPAGKKWMQDFFAACDGCTFDGLAFHWYGTESQAFIDYATDFYNTFKLDLWATEFACEDFTGGAQCTMDQVSEFMETVTSWMDNTPSVAHYAAYGFLTNLNGVNPDDALMDPAGNPTALGLAYING